MRHYKSKKADLSLSTNAIVILILAITILGLGLTFVRGLFKQAETKVAETFSATELANPPTRDNPATISPGILTLRQGASGKAVIAYFNSEPKNRVCNIDSAVAAGGDTTAATLTPSTAQATLPRDGTNTWVIAVKASITVTGTLIKPIRIQCGDDTPTGTNPVVLTKDLVVTVTT